MKKLMWTSTLPDEFKVTKCVGAHIHLDLRIDYRPAPHPLYWRETDDKSLIEIGIDANSGRLMVITVPLYRHEIRPFRVKRFMKSSAGIPAFDTSHWKTAEGKRIDDPFFDNRETFSVEVGESSLRIILSEEECPYEVITKGVVACELNSARELCGIRVDGLTEGERNSIIESILSKS